MTRFARYFRLTNERESGISCNEHGLFVGGTPLLQRDRSPGIAANWQPRPQPDLERELGKRYGLPVAMDGKIAGLKVVARALEQGNLTRARIAALHLRLPNPPELMKTARTGGAVIDLARRLQASGLLKENWNPGKHPRWPAGSDGGVGGQFAPSDAAGADTASSVASARPMPADFVLPMPMDIPFSDAWPFPSEILAPPLITPREPPKNPHPDDPECAEEWAYAEAFCSELVKQKKLRTDQYRGHGKTYSQCLMGMVSARCGGNAI